MSIEREVTGMARTRELRCERCSTPLVEAAPPDYWADQTEGTMVWHYCCPRCGWEVEFTATWREEG